MKRKFGVGACYCLAASRLLVVRVATSQRGGVGVHNVENYF